MKYIEGGASSSIEGIGVQKIRRLKITPVSVVASQQLYFYWQRSLPVAFRSNSASSPPVCPPLFTGLIFWEEDFTLEV